MTHGNTENTTNGGNADLVLLSLFKFCFALSLQIDLSISNEHYYK